MLFSKVGFKNFSIEPDKIIGSLSYAQPAYWPAEWEIVILDTEDRTSIRKWCDDHMAGTCSIIDTYHRTIVGFSVKADAILFKISFQPTNGVIY